MTDHSQPNTIAESTTNRTGQPADDRLIGIRGWLILPAIGLVLSIIVGPIALIEGIAEMGPRYGTYSLPATLVNLGFYIWIWVAAVRFFKKRKSAPKTLIQLMVARIIASAMLFVLGMAVVGRTDPLVIIALLKANNFIAQGIAAAIWIPYFKVSKRVRATFVR